MKWGIGTGRCGTLSLAQTYGGVHEPPPDIVILSAACKYNENNPCFALLRRLVSRRDMQVPMVVDTQQTLALPVIKRIDKHAWYFWVFREPVATITSCGEYWSLSDWDYTMWVDNLLEGLPESVQRATARYIVFHEFIMDFFKLKEDRVRLKTINVEDLKICSNKTSPDNQAKLIEQREKYGGLVREYTQDVWAKTQEFVNAKI